MITNKDEAKTMTEHMDNVPTKKNKCYSNKC